MADEPEQYPGDASGHMRPELAGIVGSMPDATNQYANSAATKIQDYLTTKQIASNAQQAGEQFVQNLNGTKNNLLQMVQNDPGATKLALSLAPDIVEAHTAEAGHEPGTHQPIIDEMQNQIAHTAVTTYANRNPDAARAALASDLGGYLAPADHARLSTYIDNQEMMQNQDKQARAMQAQKDAVLTSFAKSGDYLGHLAHPQTGDVTFPPGWGQALMADGQITPATRAALHDAYTNLMNNGDVKQSDPMAIHDAVTRIAAGQPVPQSTILNHIGTRVSLADGSFLNSMLAPKTPEQKQATVELAGHLAQAKSQIMDPNGAGGRVAYGRFMNWLMPALRAGGNLGELMANNRVQQFAPTGNDVMQATRNARNV